MRMQRISPNMPAPVTPIASATTTQFSGMASMAPRVEIGFDQLSGVARSSRTGTKRSVKAGPTTRLPEKPNGIAPAIQDRRIPFFSSIVVMVPLVAPPDPGHERNCEQHHPELAEDLTEQEFKRSKRQP